MQRTLPVILAATLVAWAGSALATPFSLTFSEFGHGDVVTDSQGVSIDADNFHRAFDFAVAFDTDESGTADMDLEFGGGWTLGNLAGDNPLGNILILQENDTDCATGTCSDPDDEQKRPAGSFDLLLTEVFTGFSFDLVDVEAMGENGSIAFYLGDAPAPAAAFGFDDFLGWGQGVQYGNNSANHIDFEGHLSAPFDRVVITMGGSGGIDNLTLVPEPGTAALLGFGLLGLAYHGRRR